VNARGMSIGNRFADRGALGSALNFDPTQPVKDENSPYGGYFTWTQPNGDPITIATRNPVAMLELRKDVSSVKRFIGNFQADYRFHFMPELRANLNLATDRSSSNGTVNVPDYAMMNFDRDDQGKMSGGVDRTYDQKKTNDLLDFYLNYVKETSFGKFDLMGGYSWQHFWRKGTNYSTNVAESIIYDDSEYATENYLISFFGRLNYIFKSRYMLTFTLRDDGSSRFSPDNRWGLFPSVALAWDIAKENFVKGDFLKTLKLRLGYGITGQQDIGGDYPYLPRYTYGLDNAQVQFGNTFITTLRPEGYDENLKWEQTTTYNIGLDYGFLENRITGSIEGYYRKTTDLLNFIPVPAGTNLTNQIMTNVGDLYNKGLEFSINATAVSKKDMKWDIGFNLTYNKNEITKLTATNDPNYLGVFTGGILGGVGNNIQIHSVGYPANSFYVYEQVYDENGTPIEGLYVDRNNDGMITVDDRYQYKDPAPAVFMGFSSMFTLKNFDFSFAGRINLGNYVYNNMFSNYGTYSTLYNSVGYLSNVTTSLLETHFENPKYFSNYYVEDASFLRMDHITLGYSFSNIEWAKFRIYGTVQNAFVITGYDGLDPEVANGIDSNVYPRPRTFLFGVSASF
jgi:iron complex outermembrane receptor protein